MKYGELSNDISNSIVAKRIELEKTKNESYRIYETSTWQLSKLQRECKHEHAVIRDGWQGGGIYYTYCTCPECGRSGTRYIPQYHMYMNNKWYKMWGNLESLLILEEAVKIGKRIENGWDSDYWWGEIEDYDKLTKDTSRGNDVLLR